jgi:hypothetical protein
MILWPNKKCLVGPRMVFDVVNPRMLELEVAKEIQSERPRRMIAVDWRLSLFISRHG